MSQKGPQILVAVLGVLLLGGIVLFRHTLRAPEPEVERPVAARLPTRGAQQVNPNRIRPDWSDADVAAAPAPPASGSKIKVAADANSRTNPPRLGANPSASVPNGGPVNDPVPAETAAAHGSAPVGATLSVSFDGSANSANQAPPIIANELEFDPALGAVRLPPGGVLAYPDAGGIETNEGSVAMWVRPEWDESQPSKGKALVELTSGTWENRLEVSLSFNYVRFMLTTSDGVEHAAGFSGTFASGEWHNVAVTWGEPALSLYIDGSPRNEVEYSGTTVIPPGTPLYIGSSRTGPLPGMLAVRGLNVFQRRLADDEIAAIVEQSAPSGG